jgi:hypothetical protein
MHTHDQHFLLIGPIENRNPPTLRQVTRGAPEEIMLDFSICGLFETVDAATLWVYA